MPVYLPKGMPIAERQKKTLYNVCKVCGEWLGFFLDNDPASPHHGETFIACHDWFRTHHDGIQREASQLQQQGVAGMNITARRDFMEEKFGKETTTALEKFQGVTSLSKNDAMIILESIWPGAPKEEKMRAALLCVSYHLNPLMKHIYLIPFNKKKDGRVIETVWATVMGIGATRLLASRKGTFSYTDDTPRIMTEEEQVKRFGQSYPERLYVIVKVKDPKTGAEVPGYGWWPKSAVAYGEDKGNTQFNMAANRAERQALSRLRPGEMPDDIDIMEDNVAEEASKTGVVIEGTAREIASEEPATVVEEQTTTEESLIPPEPEAKVEPAPDKPPDQSPIAKEDVAKIQTLAKQAAMTISDLGKMMANELKWKVPPKLSDLKAWQGTKLIDILNKAVGTKLI